MLNSKRINTNITSNSSNKNELVEINEELKGIRSYFIKLQESLIYIQTNEEEKFLKNTYIPLIKVLNLELKIEVNKFNYNI